MNRGRRTKPRLLAFFSPTGWLLVLLTLAVVFCGIFGAVALARHLQEERRKPIPITNWQNYMGAVRHSAKEQAK